MRIRASVLVCAIGVFAFVSLPAVPAAAQAGSWKVPRTADGHPDLQGVWANNSVTPLERPDALADRTALTDEELAELKATADELFSLDAGDAAFADQLFLVALEDPDEFTSSDGGTGNYNQFWLVERDFNSRTSLITDPPNGKLPTLTPKAQARTARAVASRGQPAQWTQDRGLSERCITFGVPSLFAGYNSYYQIVQSHDHVAIVKEMIHDARIIPLDGRPHLNDGVRQWHGDSRGWWDGETLVVETTNYSPKSNFRGAAEHLRVIERFTRVGPDAIEYEITASDPTMWARPWTAMIPLKKSEDSIFEYACHEGNVGMGGILSGARAEERAQGTAPRDGSSSQGGVR